mmetsp:Transcript_32541/g.77335  ORF Transcript_32541/g.77335 Transcript_32541/m.77335 type:complete len:226 (-) Transcript_32541:76-753(-)
MCSGQCFIACCTTWLAYMFSASSVNLGSSCCRRAAAMRCFWPSDPCSSTHLTTKFPKRETMSLSKVALSRISSTRGRTSSSRQCPISRSTMRQPYLLQDALSMLPSSISLSTKSHCSGGSTSTQRCSTWLACGAANGDSQASLTWPTRPMATSCVVPVASATSSTSCSRRLPFGVDASRQIRPGICITANLLSVALRPSRYMTKSSKLSSVMRSRSPKRDIRLTS